ncbi:MAG: biotin synthase BioB [Candidatus Abyssobacteria bacterium SURF_5]|uniref:Biotin synthase n=1 Tax=Abyssobacteria bacterium (strain SURF_5) TaxID=2093360 RepID=A0A3A4N8D9_ABYX5|nr:MAG: biotin synthase BioB [Candidatus Abyssubacteria bacterium SURF_5]
MVERKNFAGWAERVTKGERLEQAEALAILETPRERVFHLLAAANDVRRHFKGDTIDLCGVVNAKSGMCSEDCAFCAQSAHHDTGVAVYPLMDASRILEHARAAEQMSAHRFGIVTSGRGVDKDHVLDCVCAALAGMEKTTALGRCASLGTLSREQLLRLKDAGLQSIHHNIETAESFFSSICSTHTYADRVETVRAAKEVGFVVCCGGIFGMGETNEHRVEMALALRALQVDSVPLNFLNPIPGTRLESAQPLSPLEILKIIAMFRFMMPDKDIRTCGGRERNLRSLQPLMYVAGANGSMIGNYLTTLGRDPREDLEMISDLGLTT